VIDVYVIHCAKGQICPHISIASTAERGVEIADQHDCGPHEAFRHVRYEAVEEAKALIYELCNTLTHGREHLDVWQCAADALKRAKEFRSALIHTWGALDNIVACGVDSCCRESAIAARDEAADLVKPYQDVI
jgi:hypothetical protein